jgi:DNA mismatch repair ATPase MutS
MFLSLFYFRSSLQIFQTDSHPSAFKVDSKEGFSLFSVLNRTKTSAGATLLRSWLKAPCRNLAVLQERQALVAFFVDPAFRELAHELAKCLSGITNIAVCYCIVVWFCD